MIYVTLLSGIILSVLILLQVGDGGLNVALTTTLQAPVERRGAVKTMHVMTIVMACVFVLSAILQFLLA